MKKNILMCAPTYFGIEYEINSWMHTENDVNHAIAQKQWEDLYGIYSNKLGWNVNLVEPIQGLPDMVFATDCCLIKDGKILLSNFRYPERQPETQHFEKWLHENGYTNTKHAEHIFEGGGDNMVCGDIILAGHGFRSDAGAADEMAEYFKCKVVSLKIIDPDFYHLDTSLAVLSDDTVAYYPGAIDEESREKLKRAIPNLIEATHEEAKGFGLNAVSDGKTIITSNESESLMQKYRDAGFEVIGISILEFRKSGGGIKCLTLDLH
jgi:N-dimethylarginine dimethylaminohydrolase